MFQAMKERVDEESVRYLWGLRPVEGAPVFRYGGPLLHRVSR